MFSLFKMSNNFKSLVWLKSILPFLQLAWKWSTSCVTEDIKPVTSKHKPVTSTETVSSFTFLCLCKSCRCSSLSAGGGSKRDVKSCMTQGAIHQLHSHSLLLAFCRVGHKMKTHGKSHLCCGTEWTSCEIAAVPLSRRNLKSFCCFHHQLHIGFVFTTFGTCSIKEAGRSGAKSSQNWKLTGFKLCWVSVRKSRVIWGLYTFFFKTVVKLCK